MLLLIYWQIRPLDICAQSRRQGTLQIDPQNQRYEMHTDLVLHELEQNAIPN